MDSRRPLLLTPLLLLAACGPEAELSSGQQAIIDGAFEEGHPAVGALVSFREGDERPSGSFCSATLIDPQWVLTAAHCIDGAEGRAGGQEGPGAETFFVNFFMGTNTSSPAAARWVAAKEIFIHPGYRAPGGDRGYDIAIFELVEPVTDVDPLPIHRADLGLSTGADLLYVGFGQADGDGNGSGRKRSATLRLHTVNPTVYITAQGGGGVCFGDSGGPGLLTVDDHLEVVGVNSTVFGDPSCYEYSTQIRVDAYASWIDATMGRGASCTGDPDACACPEACGADGVCDNALCGGNSCPELLGCLRFCRTQLCQVTCLLRASPSANYVLEELLDCSGENCPNGDATCIDELCRRESLACDRGLDATRGDEGCGYIHRCSQACAEDDLDCQDTCFFAATLEGQAQLEGVEACAAEQCPDAETRAERLLCAADRCRDPLLTCLPDESCRLAGGSCASDSACVVEPWVATYCLPSAGLAVGAVCDLGEVACVDGAVCLDDGTGPRCLEVCATGADCSDGFAPCTATSMPGMPFSIGVCSATCPDADADGACDAEDCHPEDPSIHPGAEEVCDPERRDENCNGARNEGCWTCDDGSFSFDCAPVPAPPPASLPPAEEGCTCVRPDSPTPWGLLGLLLLPLLRRRRRGPRGRGGLALLGLGLVLAAGCSDGDDADAGVGLDAGFVDVGTPDAGFEAWDAGVWPDPSVWRIQQGLEPVGRRVELSDLVVTSPLGTDGFFVAEAPAGPYRGVWVALEGVDPAALQLDAGDVVTLQAEIAERGWDPADEADTTRTRTELVLRSATDLTVTGEAPMPAPSEVTRPELAVADLSERFEGVVVTLTEATVTDTDPEALRIVVDDLVLVDDLFLALELSWLEPGTRFDVLTGPLHYEDGAFMMVPRTEADMVRAPVVFEGCIPDEGYTVCPTELRWAEARQACGALGGRLVILETQEENVAVGGIARRWFDSAFWVGMSDQEVEGDWRWVDGSTLTYDPWGSGEPNNAGRGEDCVHSNWRGDGVWNDLPCRRREPYVCEFPGDGARCASDDDCSAGPGDCVDGSCVPR